MERYASKHGVHPLIALLLVIAVFIFGSVLLFAKVEFASVAYATILLYFLLAAGNRKRTELIQMIFSKKKYRVIRLIENGMILLPFLLFLIYQQQFLWVPGLLIFTILFSFIETTIQSNWVHPTPFKKLPFEHIVGFRKTFWVVALSYFLLIKAIQVDNYNLGVFSLLVVLLNSMGFYLKPENEFFVWIYSGNVNQFLKKKFLVATQCISLLYLPILIALYYFFPDQWLITTVATLISFVFLGAVIITKYTSFPDEITIVQGMLFAIGLSFPPVLIFIMWLFYSQAKQRLKSILHD